MVVTKNMTFRVFRAFRGYWVLAFSGSRSILAPKAEPWWRDSSEVLPGSGLGAGIGIVVFGVGEVGEHKMVGDQSVEDAA